MGAIGKLGPNESLIGQQGSRLALSTPALVLDLDRLERNIAYLADYLGNAGHGVRPVAKIHKSVEVAKRQIEAGALGQCCATLAEAEVMADAGIPGVLLFSQVVTEPKIARLAALNARADGLLAAVDDAAVVDRLAAAARDAGKPLRMLVDFEVGGRRTGLVAVDDALALARHIAATEGAVYAGIQGYNGSFQREPDFDARRAEQERCTGPLAELCERLGAEGLPPEIVSGGGTVAAAVRMEALLEFRPRLAFSGNANFLDPERRQSVSADLSTLSAMVAAYADLPALGLPKLGPFDPFVGAGIGVARIWTGETQMMFPKTTTHVPSGQRTGLAWMVTAGVATALNESTTLELAWRYSDLGTAETGTGSGQVVWRDGSRDPLPLNLAPTEARLRSHGLRLSVRYLF